MADLKFKANIYGVDAGYYRGEDFIQQDVSLFSRAIAKAVSDSLKTAIIDIGGSRRRFEEYDQNGPLHFLNFVTFRHPGPGRAGVGVPVSPMILGPDEDYAHETAALYDADNATIFIETGRPGMAAGAIAEFFTLHAPANYTFRLTPKMDPSAAARARRQVQIRKLIMRVDVKSGASADQLSRVGMGASIAHEIGGHLLDVEIGVGRQRKSSMDPGRVFGFIDDLLGRSKDGDVEFVQELKVGGREHEDEEVEVIDLFQHREKRETTLPVDPNERKVLHTNRWAALAGFRNAYFR